MNITIKQLRKIIREELQLLEIGDNSNKRIAQEFCDKALKKFFSSSEWLGLSEQEKKDYLSDSDVIDEYILIANELGIHKDDIDLDVIKQIATEILDEQAIESNDDEEDNYQDELDHWESGNVDDLPNPYGAKPKRPKNRDDWEDMQDFKKNR